jgi:GNAT superfamily N-acetyltransferase
MSIKIIPAEGKLLKTYIDFPHELYANDQYYVPELYMAQKDMFSRKKNPFFEHAEVESFIAQKEGKTVGRISAILNHNYNDYHKCNVGFFGFFDVINDYEVAKALLDTAATWCRNKGCETILGPTNFSTNDTAGILVEGYEEPAKIMMTYNKPYYRELVEKYGFVKDIDLYAYILYTDKASEKSIRLAQSLEERLNRQGITFRNINLKNFKAEVAAIRDIYNDAWASNWGFVPWTDAELDHLANELKLIAHSNWIFMAEDKGKPIGFGLTLHDVNEVTKSFKKGRLLPFNILKLLLNKNKTRFVRILALGVKNEYRRKGIEAIFFAKNILQARKEKIVAGEVSWVLENNIEMNASAEKLNSELYKTYRIYKYNLS